MAKTARLELRVEPELKARLDERCDVLGMKVATFVERAVESALEFEGRLPKPPVAKWVSDEMAAAASRAPVAVFDALGGIPSPDAVTVGRCDHARDFELSEGESSAGCPECGGAWTPVLSPEGGYRMCRDCGGREAS